MTESVPTFAGDVIQQMLRHALPWKEATEEDLHIIRTVFRRSGGSWESLVGGDITQYMLLLKVVTAWGKEKDHGRISKQ